MAPALLDALRAAVGDRQLLTDPDLTASYETDWTRRFSGRALAVVRPGSVEEVAAILRLCGEAGASVVPQGGNTGLVGGSVPRGGEVVLSLGRLRDIEPVDAAAGEVTAGAGVTLAALQAHVRAVGWDFGVDLGARDSATLGGMIATNAGGINVLRHGPMRQQIIGLEAVLADGSVVRRLPGMVKDNTGYHLPSLLAGSEGTLAVITRARLRLVPILPRRVVALLGLGSTEAAVALAAALRRSVASLVAAELFFEEGLALVVRHTRAARPFVAEHGAYLLVECAAAHDPTDELVAALEGVDDALLASDEAARHRLWQLREGHTDAISAEGVPHKLDVTLPLAALASFLDRLTAVVSDARAVTYGHVCDGNLHINLLGPAPDDETLDEAVLRLVIEMGGSISAEHGIGVAKARWLVADRGEADVAAMRAIKHALDPAGMLNPGVIFPLEAP